MTTFLIGYGLIQVFIIACIVRRYFVNDPERRRNSIISDSTVA